MNSNLPSGTVTFLFTDIEGSTQLWEKHPEAMQAALPQHDELLRAAIGANNGQIVKTTGDGVHAVFASALDGIAAAVEAQRALQSRPWQETVTLRVRMALHTGESELREGDYYGTAVNRAARLMAVAAGGQCLVSQTTAALTQDSIPAQINLLDLGEHRLKDLVRPERIFQVTAPGLKDDFPPLKSLNAYRHNLPVQLTSFVGREKEIGEAHRLLKGTHLLTLTGPGGTGKTRLSLQIAAEVMPEFPDGAWLVELASLAGPTYILPEFAAVFNLIEVPGRPLSRVVADYLRDKTLLLVLDNCEHLIEACAQLADELLRACPGLKIIASSREVLGVAGETSYRVPSLALPSADSTIPETLMQSEAVHLFVERAQAAQPGFTLTGSNAPAIAAICRRLDGIPLALELAAARVKVLSPEQIAERLDNRFSLLVGGSRAALPRQQTLRALIDWSYDLLSEDERQLLRQLSVFAGGWSLEAAESVGAGLDVLGSLVQLANKSLVSVDKGKAEARYHLLETIRQYALEKLVEAGEASGSRSRHLDYYLHLVEAAEPKLYDREMIAALDQLEIEQDNLRAALEWALDKDLLPALRMVGALHFFWARRTSIAEGIQWVKTALTRAEAAFSKENEAGQSYLKARAKALVGQASLTFGLGDYVGAMPVFEAGISLARQINATQTLAYALGLGATVAIFLGDLTTAQAWTEECISLSRQYDYAFAFGLVLGSDLRLAVFAGQPLQSDLQEEALQAARASGNPWIIAMATHNAARLAAESGRLVEAEARFEEAGTLFDQTRDRPMGNVNRSEMGHFLRKQGRYPEALTLYRRTIPIWLEFDHFAAVAHELECIAYINIASAKNQRAARLFGAAEALREMTGSSLTPFERPEYDLAVKQLHAQMEASELKAEWNKGRSLTMEEAIQYALEESSS
jgi:predicted ATPase/class 3 adenylate cyclase